MKIDISLVDRLSNLAKLEFTEQGKLEIQKDLEKIISFVEKLNEVDTTGIEPLVYMNEDMNVVRNDIANQFITKEEALKNAPQKDSDYFKVPKVIKK
jgi:aspartyl-tRNA(Asn)/glutamyl-tRNA(Gln) amidotransferase subunit C